MKTPQYFSSVLPSVVQEERNIVGQMKKNVKRNTKKIALFDLPTWSVAYKWYKYLICLTRIPL